MSSQKENFVHDLAMTPKSNGTISLTKLKQLFLGRLYFISQWAYEMAPHNLYVWRNSAKNNIWDFSPK